MFTLRPYQTAGAEWVHRKPFALLLDEPRVGKTATLLAGARQAGFRRIAVLSPAIAREHWRREQAQVCPEASLWVESYDRLVRSTASCLRAVQTLKPEVLLLDEAHFLNNPGARRTRLVYGNSRIPGLASRVSAVWGATGTLWPNHIGEAWTHLRYAGATTLSQDAFWRRYCHTYDGEWGLVVKDVRSEHLEEFLGLLRPLSLRRRLADIWPDLPAVQWSQMPLTLSGADYRALCRLGQDADAQRAVRGLEEGQERVSGNTSSLHRQIGELKAAAVADQAEDLLETQGVQKLVIFGWHTSVLEHLHHRLRRFGAVLVHGSTTEAQRWAAMDAFQETPQCRVIVGQIRSMGTAVKLNAARHILFAELSWNLGEVVQAAKRILDPLREEHPEVLVPTVFGTLDERISTTLERKARHMGLLNSFTDTESVQCA